MQEKVINIIPVIFAEIEADGENESEGLLNYYLECNQVERASVNNVMMYLCGWSFETILQRCGIKLDEAGMPILDPEFEAEE